MQQTDTNSNAVTIEGDKTGLHVRASDNGVATVERGWEFTLNWIGHHPRVSVIILGLLGWQAYQMRRAKEETARMKLEYEAKRERSRPKGGGTRKPGHRRPT